MWLAEAVAADWCNVATNKLRLAPGRKAHLLAGDAFALGLLRCAPAPAQPYPPLPPPDSSVHGGGTRGAATVVMSWMFRSTGRHGHTKIDRLSDGTVQFAVSDPPPPAATVAALVLSTSPTQKALFGGVLPLRREHSPVAAMTAAMAATLLGEAVSVDTG